jgi:hypothetical protein
MPEIKINTENYPHLEGLMKQEPKKAREVMGVFIQLMDEAIENNWHELPELFSRELTFADLIKGVLHGSLDLPKLNPEAFDALREEVHPLSMLSPRKDHLNGGMRIYNWRHHFRLPSSAVVNQKTIEDIFRKLLRYYKYVKVDKLAEAIINNQIATFKSINQAELLPFYPALRYQEKNLGELHVGTFLEDVGAFDLGEIPKAYEDECPACQGKEDMWEVNDKLICPRCNAGFIKPE